MLLCLTKSGKTVKMRQPVLVYLFFITMDFKQKSKGQIPAKSTDDRQADAFNKRVQPQWQIGMGMGGT